MNKACQFLLSLLVLTFSQALLAKNLRVGIAPDSPPLAFYENGHLSGIEVAAAESLGKLMNRKIKFVEKPFNDLIPALENGEIDIIMSGMSITEERAKRINFSNPYMDAGQMAIIRFEDAGQFGFKGAIFRPGMKIAVEANTTGSNFVESRLRNAQVTKCNTLAEALDKLKKREVDFVVHDAPSSWALASNKDMQDLMSLNHAMTEELLGWAVAKNNPELLEAVNQQLAHMQKTGILRAITNQWIPVTIELEEKP